MTESEIGTSLWQLSLSLSKSPGYSPSYCLHASMCGIRHQRHVLATVVHGCGGRVSVVQQGLLVLVDGVGGVVGHAYERGEDKQVHGRQVEEGDQSG